jgi:hypothetical protein
MKGKENKRRGKSELRDDVSCEVGEEINCEVGEVCAER